MSSLARRTREVREAEEERDLAPLATKSASSKGRLQPEEQDRYRTCFERDRDRILHSKAFRRLKHKTQVFINPEGDHFVTRLTHTVQVTQIGRAMAVALGLNEALTEAICLGHDVGHSPFGHIGEEALSPYVEGNWLHAAQSVRVLQVLEPQNLTHEVVDGIGAHSWRINPPPATPEGMLCRYADRIAYLTHDVGDAIRAGVIAESDVPASSWDTFGRSSSEWIGTMITSVVEESHATNSVAMAPGHLAAMHQLREFMFARVYLRPETEGQRRDAVTIIRELTDHFSEHPEKIPDTFRHDDAPVIIQAVDYVAGMTDRFALRVHDELFGETPHGRSLVDP